MSDGVSIDTSELQTLAADFGKASAGLLKDVDKVAKKAAQNIKDDLSAQAAASTHFRGMAGSISYERAYGLGSVGYEVGPDKDRRGGALGNIFFFGVPEGGGGTGDLDAPLAAEGPRFVKALSELAEDRLT